MTTISTNTDGKLYMVVFTMDGYNASRNGYDRSLRKTADGFYVYDDHSGLGYTLDEAKAVLRINLLERDNNIYMDDYWRDEFVSQKKQDLMDEDGGLTEEEAEEEARDALSWYQGPGVYHNESKEPVFLEDDPDMRAEDDIYYWSIVEFEEPQQEEEIKADYMKYGGKEIRLYDISVISLFGERAFTPDNDIDSGVESGAYEGTDEEIEAQSYNSLFGDAVNLERITKEDDEEDYIRIASWLDFPEDNLPRAIYTFEHRGKQGLSYFVLNNDNPNIW